MKGHTCRASVGLISMFVLSTFVSGCAMVESRRVDSGHYEIYAYGFGDTKAKVVQEANLKCGPSGVDFEKLKCGSICTVGVVRCRPATQVTSN